MLARAQNFSLSQKNPDWLWGPRSLLFDVYRGLFLRGYCGVGLRLATYIHIVPELRMSGVILLLPLYAFLLHTATDLPLPLPSLVPRLWYDNSWYVSKVQDLFKTYNFHSKCCSMWLLFNEVFAKCYSCICKDQNHAELRTENEWFVRGSSV
jgi:hypothetical protein